MKKLYSYHYSIMSALNHRYMRETYEICYENDRKINIDASLRNVKYFEAVFFIIIVVDINKFIIRRTKFILIVISFRKLIYNNPRIIILVIFHFQKVK